MNLSPLFKFKNQSDLDNFNAAVDLYNAELRRRRAYLVERTQADLQLGLDRLESRLGQTEETLSATVIAPPSLAKETFARIYKGKAPAAYVRERGKPAATLIRRALAASAVQICSYSGAKRFEYNLVTAKPRRLSADEGNRLFDPGFKPGQPFTLAITWSPYTPPPREKKETRCGIGSGASWPPTSRRCGNPRATRRARSLRGSASSRDGRRT